VLPTTFGDGKAHRMDDGMVWYGNDRLMIGVAKEDEHDDDGSKNDECFGRRRWSNRAKKCDNECSK